jgi:hypothetical protein
MTIISENANMSKKKNLKVFLPEMVDVSRLVWDDNNPNEQDVATSKSVRKNIEEQGFDENLIVIPLPETDDNGLPKLKVVSGNHKGQYAVEKGARQLPAVIRDDWDHVTAVTQSVRRNIDRGSVEKKAFTDIVLGLHKEGLTDAEVMTRMGIHEQQKYDNYIIAKAMEAEEEVQRGAVSAANKDETEVEVANRIKLIDNIGYVVSEILDKYGATVPYSFIVFPVAQGGRKHMYIQSTPGLKTVLTRIAQECIKTGQDMSTTLTGLLNIGLANTKFAEVPEVSDNNSDFLEFNLDEL